MKNKLKKILLVSSYAPPSIGGPQNLYNLLRHFPVEQYSILTSYFNIDNLSAQKGNWLPGEYVFYDNPKADKETRRGDAQTGKIGSKLSQAIQKLRFTMKRFTVIRVLGGLPVILSQILAIVRVGVKTVKREKPEMLVGFSDYGPAMLGTFFIHKLTKKPYHIFLFDLYKGNFLPFPGELFASIFEKAILLNAEKIIVTNSGTQKLYEKRYGEQIRNKIVIIHNSVFPEDYFNTNVNKTIVNNNLTKTILFTGRIYWPQIGALKNLIQTVNEMNDANLQLNIYSPSPKEYLKEIGIFESEKVKLGVATPKEIPEIQKNADILFLPLSWHTKSQAIIDTATPGKLTDYLIAGKPILIHAPASTYLVEYAKEKNFALAVDQENIEKLKAGIRRLLTDLQYTQGLVKNARATFFENHDANKTKEIFRDLFLVNRG